MKTHELANLLLKEDNMEIMILDGFNGGGRPRTINCGPYPHMISADDQEGAADCEELRLGQKVLVMGYGCY